MNQGEYTFNNGFNVSAIVALLMGIVPNIPGFLEAVGAIDKGVVWPWIAGIYHYAWFVGFFVSGCTYLMMMKKKKEPNTASVHYNEAAYHVNTN